MCASFGTTGSGKRETSDCGEPSDGAGLNADGMDRTDKLLWLCLMLLLDVAVTERFGDPGREMCSRFLRRADSSLFTLNSRFTCPQRRSMFLSASPAESLANSQSCTETSSLYSPLQNVQHATERKFVILNLQDQILDTVTLDEPDRPVPGFESRVGM
jgi:hypothetical protein